MLLQTGVIERRERRRLGMEQLLLLVGRGEGGGGVAAPGRGGPSGRRHAASGDRERLCGRQIRVGSGRGGGRLGRRRIRHHHPEHRPGLLVEGDGPPVRSDDRGRGRGRGRGGGRRRRQRRGCRRRRLYDRVVGRDEWAIPPVESGPRREDGLVRGKVPPDPLVDELDVGGEVVPDHEGPGALAAAELAPGAVATKVLHQDGGRGELLTALEALVPLRP